MARLQAEALGGPGVELTGKVVLVTGASKGIGAATVRALGAAGAHVVAHYGSDESGARAATAAISGDRKLLVQADFGDPEAPRRLWEAAVSWRGRVDVLVNNAAVMEESSLGAADELWQRAWERAFGINVLAPATLTRDAVRHFTAAGGGVVITVSSWVAQRGTANPNLIAYAASKAAVKAMTQTIARYCAKDGILAYVVSPGVVRTRLSEIAAAQTGGEEAVTATLAMGEWVPPAELAELIVFLASGHVRHLTGATLDVNGATYVR